MNDKENLDKIHVSFWNLVGLKKHEFIFTHVGYDCQIPYTPKKNNKPWPAFYNQSCISDIVEEYTGIKTMGQCYTKPSFEIKWKDHV